MQSLFTVQAGEWAALEVLRDEVTNMDKQERMLNSNMNDFNLPTNHYIQETSS